MAEQDAAAGLAAYALVMELIGKLEDCSVISRDEGASVIDAALVGLEKTAAEYPGGRSG